RAPTGDPGAAGDDALRRPRGGRRRGAVAVLRRGVVRHRRGAAGRRRLGGVGLGAPGLGPVGKLLDGSDGVWTRLTPPARRQILPPFFWRAGGRKDAPAPAGVRPTLT